MSWNDLKVEREHPFISESIIWVQAEENRLGEVRNSKKVWRWVEQYIFNRHHQLVLSIAYEGEKSFFCLIKGKEYFVFVVAFCLIKGREYFVSNQNAPILA